MSHTPTPWAQDEVNLHLIYQAGTHPYRYLLAVDPGGFSTSETTGDEDDANAAHIVSCVNSHDALVESMRYIQGNIAAALKKTGTQGAVGDLLLSADGVARAALKAAEES